MKSWFAGGFAALLLTGCASDLGWSLRFAYSQPVEVSELARAAECGTQDEKSAVSVFTDVAEIRQWQERRGIKLIDSDVLPAGPYALVEMGRRATGGYGLAVSRKAGIRRDLVVLKATFIEPDAGQAVTQSPSSPCVLVGLPSGFNRGVVVYNQNGDIQATSLSKD